MDEKKLVTLGAFFSGSGGFELAGQMVGIVTLWESEIEPLPIRVTQVRFPDAKQLGDIRRINGAMIAPVDIVTGGSPCQNMSVAGDRIGLNGKQSVLFLEYVRVVKEMRIAYGKPRYMVWENVPGAFSSNKGEDFRRVLEEIARIAKAEAFIPRPAKGKWRAAGAILGDGYSMACRVLDAQYWGVPQQRKRIYLVADFDGESAAEILFKREGLCRNSLKIQEAGKEVARETSNCIEKFVYAIQGNMIGRADENGPNGSGIRKDVSFTLTARDRHGVAYEARSGEYLARRLTPLECGRLQGFPDYWTEGLSLAEPDEEEVQFWKNVWANWWDFIGRKKGIKHPKDEKAVRRWLKNPVSDTGLYKMWGNGIALPCALYVLEGIIETLGKKEIERFQDNKDNWEEYRKDGLCKYKDCSERSSKNFSRE